MSPQPNYLWWQTGVIYQIYPRSFMDASSDGIGDLAGVTQQLDYLSSTLGVDAIWLSPFYPSPMADFGYDVSDYTDVDPLFGNLADFDRLVTEAHARGLKVIIDIVPNHTSDQHAWFLASRSSRSHPQRDWYVWRDAKPGGAPPNNWLSVFGGSAWTWDAPTGQYYLHSFLKEQPDLNWRNPAVREAMMDVYRFWLERGVDGFRIDVAHSVMKDPDLRDNPPNPNPAAVAEVFKSLAAYDSQLHLHDKGHPDVHCVYQELRQILDAYGPGQPRMMVGEIHVFDLSEWAKYYGAQLDEFHLPGNFGMVGITWDAQRIRRVVNAIEAAVPPGGWPNYVLGNHDEHRLATRYGRAQARVAALLLLTLRGTPTIYYGDEIGMTDVPIPPELEQDPWGKQVPGTGLGRDPERSPMQWSAAAHAGFTSPATPSTWLPVAVDYAQVNVAAQVDDPTSFLTLYRRLLALRRASTALRWGDYHDVASVPADTYVYRRTTPDEEWLVALNFAAGPRRLQLDQFGAGEIALATGLDRAGPVDLAGLTLTGNEGLLIRLR